MRLQFFIRTSQKKKPVKIKMRLRDGETINIYGDTGQYVHPKDWSNKRQMPILRADNNYDDLIEKLQGIEKAVRKEYIKEPDKTVLNKEWLNTVADKYLYPEKYEEKQLTFFEFIENFIERSKKHPNPKSGKPVTNRTIQNYNKTLDELENYRKKKKMKELDWQDVDMDFYYSFIDYLKHKPLKKSNEKTQKGLALNTIGKRIRTLKVFLNAAEAEGYPVKPIFKKKFTAFSVESEHIYLTESELEKIFNYDFSHNKKLEKVRDMFILASWTGLRYGDVKKLTSENFTDRFIKIEQSKTGDSVTLPIHPTVKQLLKKYNGELPEPISNQNFNKYLKQAMKEIASKDKDDTGFKEKIHKSTTVGDQTISKSFEKWEMITTHTARRSFATNLYKKGVPSITIMKVTGHKTESAFLKYIKVTEEEHARKIEEMWNKEAEHLRKVE